jgi:threonine dehydratase
MVAPLAVERREAAELVTRAGLLRTPLIASPVLSAEVGCEVRLKLECQQVTGSFKLRGAIAAVARVPESETVVTASAGNHGIGIAYACSYLGREAEILVPRGTDAAKIAALRNFGPSVRIVVVDGTYDDTEVAAREAATRPGTRFVSSYNDPMVVAGQSTVGAEVLDQWPEAEAVVVPVGGGGLLAGVSLCCAEAPRPVSAWGVELASSPAMSSSLERGEITRIQETHPSLAQGLTGNLDQDSITFRLVRDHAAGVLLIEEEQVLTATAQIYTAHTIVVEPSGAAALPALPSVAASGAQRIVCILTGSNVSAETHFDIISKRPPDGTALSFAAAASK